jgi:hypothetical protein
MAPELLIDVTGGDGRVLEPDWLVAPSRAPPVAHRPAGRLCRALRAVFANGGRMAWRPKARRCAAWRCGA